MPCDFTYDHYLQVLDTILLKYEIITDLSKAQMKNVLFLRHDVDISVEPALNMAKLEHKYGISSTYYFQIAGVFYNMVSYIGDLKEILSMGHKIGLHVCEIENLSEELEIFNSVMSILNSNYSDFSLHNPKCKDGVDLLFKNGYSDSRGMWKDGCPCSNGILDGEPIQIIVHPIYWGKDSKTNIDCFRKEINRKLQVMNNILLCFYDWGNYRI